MTAILARPREAGRHRRAQAARASYADVLTIREFRWLWLAQVQSCVGDQFAQVAIAILVYHGTGSPFLTALAYALSYLPPIAGGQPRAVLRAVRAAVLHRLGGRAVLGGALGPAP